MKCAAGIKYQALDKVYWFCGIKCVELRRDYITVYTITSQIDQPSDHIIHILDTILDNSGIHEFYEVESPTAATDAVSVHNRNVVLERGVSCQRSEISI